MGKQHDFTLVKFWIGDNEIPLTNFTRLRYSLGYTTKHHGAGVSSDYHHVFDVKTTMLRQCEMMKNTYTIKWANDHLRPLAESVARARYPRGHVIEYSDIYPGKTSKQKETTPEEAKAVLLASMSKEELRAWIDSEE